jgi:hypothetical protein
LQIRREEYVSGRTALSSPPHQPPAGRARQASKQVRRNSKCDESSHQCAPGCRLHCQACVPRALRPRARGAAGGPRLAMETQTCTNKTRRACRGESPHTVWREQPGQTTLHPLFVVALGASLRAGRIRVRMGRERPQCPPGSPLLSPPPRSGHACVRARVVRASKYVESARAPLSHLPILLLKARLPTYLT